VQVIYNLADIMETVLLIVVETVLEQPQHPQQLQPHHHRQLLHLLQQQLLHLLQQQLLHLLQQLLRQLPQLQDVFQTTTATAMFHIIIKAKNVLGLEELIAAEVAL
jgi:hypothetical protein